MKVVIKQISVAWFIGNLEYEGMIEKMKSNIDSEILLISLIYIEHITLIYALYK